MSGRIADVLPLTPGQEGILFHAVRDTEGPDPYLVQLRLGIGPATGADAVRTALAALMDRHPHLRACFRHERLDRPVQVVPHAVRVPWTEVDLTGRTPDQVESGTAEFLARDRGIRFDPARPPLVRAALIRHDRGRELVLTCHHILIDGWSVPILERDLAALVTGAPLPPAVPYRQYALWLSRQDQGLAREAWREALAGLERPAPLVPDRAADTTALTDTLRLPLTAGLTTALVRRAAEAGVTLNTLTQAAWALVLARLTGARDVVFGGVVAGRPHDLPGAGEMVGMFINTLPVRVRLRDEETVAALLTRVQDEQSRLGAHHHARLAEVQRLAGGGTGELFDSVLAFENFPRGAEDAEDAPDGVRVLDVQDATHYPVTLAVVAGERMLLAVGCRHGIRADTVAARMVRAFEQLTGDLDTPVGRIDVLPEAEHRALLARSAGAPADRTAEPATVPVLFAAQAARTPDAPAVEADGETLTYARLDAESDRLARRLAGAGVGHGATVGLLLRRSPALVVAQLAVAKAGACWLPLDPAQPGDRLSRLVEKASTDLVLTDGEEPGQLLPAIRHLSVRGDSPEAPIGAPARPGSAACVMYTSGSSGEPKGVVVPHRAVVALAADRRFGNGAHRRVLLHSPHTFDAATYETWVPLLNGGTVVVCPDEPVTPALLARVLPERRVSALWLTAELFRTVAELAPEVLRGPREVWTGGDVVDPEAVRRVREHCPGLAVVNGYGPTETTVFATAHRVTESAPGAPVPIGGPLDGTRVHVLDAALRPVPDGGVGEVYVAGTGLAHGYLGLPGATAERFVADPYGDPGTRMYRTGDLARRAPDGALEFAGRADDQLKIRGFRVEPAEIEAALATCPGVTRAVVAARPAPDGGKRLVAWVVLADGDGAGPVGDGPEAVWHGSELVGRGPGPVGHGPEPVGRGPGPVGRGPEAVGHGPGPAGPGPAGDGPEPVGHGPGSAGHGPDPLERVREAAALILPRHLLPTAWARVDAVPLTPHGKADRAALPQPRTAPAPSRVPRTAREKELCELFGGVLGLPDVGPDTDFFAAGGHSLSALRLVGRIEKAWGERVPVATLFAAPTPAALIARLDTPDADLAGSLAPLITLRAQGADTPLFCVHPGLGVSWAFTALLPHLAPGRPVHALQAAVLSEDTPRFHHSVADLAEEYVGRVRAVRPHGPYLLLGRSFGGPVAHEMAVRLRAAGEEVALLAVVDAMPKPPEIARTPLEPAVADEEARRILREEGAVLDGIGEHRLAALTESVAHHLALARRWIPSPYDGTVTLFAASRDAEAVPTEVKAAAWRRFAAGVDVHELACAHVEVLDPDQAARIGAVLEQTLQGE